MAQYNYVKHNGKRCAEHRAVLEEHLGRPLEKTEIVHHINENSLDNRVENLRIMTSRDHRKIHSKGKNKVVRTASVRPDQDAWLKAHKELNFSAFVQKKLDEEMGRK